MAKYYFEVRTNMTQALERGMTNERGWDYGAREKRAVDKSIHLARQIWGSGVSNARGLSWGA